MDKFWADFWDKGFALARALDPVAGQDFVLPAARALLAIPGRAAAMKPYPGESNGDLHPLDEEYAGFRREVAQRLLELDVEFQFGSKDREHHKNVTTLAKRLMTAMRALWAKLYGEDRRWPC